MNNDLQIPQGQQESTFIPVLPRDTKQGGCGTTADGSPACAAPHAGQAASCACPQRDQSLQSEESGGEQSVFMETTLPKQQGLSRLWFKLRGGAMFVIACIISPCCTPLYVPLALALLGGTPVAIWLTSNIGWVYGGLTLLSIVSLVLGFRWLGKKPMAKPATNATWQAISLSTSELNHSQVP